MTVYNFSAGPAVLPKPVLKQAQKDTSVFPITIDKEMYQYIRRCQNDNSFDGIINNTPVIPNNEAPTTEDEEKKKAKAASVLEELKKKQPEEPQQIIAPIHEDIRKKQCFECERNM